MNINNSNGKNSHQKDSFLNSYNQEYIRVLSNNETFTGLVEEMQRKYKSDELYKIAKRTMKKIETGKCSTVEELERNEAMLIVCLFAIVDYEKSQILEVAPDKIEIVK